MGKWLTRLILGKEATEPDPNDELRDLNEAEKKKRQEEGK